MVAAALFAAGPAHADWLLSGYVGVAYDSIYDYEYEYYPDRISREHRLGAELDDWIERGNATVTLSPVFDQGIRIAAWANGYGEPSDYELGLGSAIYLFRIPREARQIRVRIRYEGEGVAPELGDYEIAGRVWIRNLRKEADSDPDAPLEGDTFALRKDRRTETIRVPAAGHVNDEGFMELHVVADGANRVDVAYIDVETYVRAPDVRVIRRYIPSYTWRPWYAYTYHYFYGGPTFFFTDYDYYLFWDFPYYDTAYIGLRRAYWDYLHYHYLLRYPSARVYVRHHTVYDGSRPRYVNRWTPELNRVRDEYERGRTSAKVRRPPDEAMRLRESLTTTLRSYREAPVASSVATHSYAKSRRGAPAEARPSTRTYGLPSAGGSDAIKSRRGAPYERSTDDLMDALRRARTRSVTPSPSEDEWLKRRRSAAPPAATPAPRPSRSQTPAPSSSASKSRRSSEESSSSKSSSSSSAASDEDEENKKKRRR
jgi:hypothetical protein